MKGVVSILVALCLAYLHNVNANVKVLRKSAVTTDKKLAFWTESYTNEHLTYALCDNKHLQGDTIKCTVIREKKPYGVDTYTRDVTLQKPRDYRHSKYLPNILVYPFGQKYVVLAVWQEDKYLQFTIVQMDSCKVNDVRFYTGGPSLEWYSVPFVGHSNSFDVFFNDTDLCSDKMCKATINADGRISNEPKSSIKKYLRYGSVLRPVVALDDGPSGNGYYYITADGHDYLHMLVKPDGTEISLVSHSEPIGLVGVSTKNNLLGVYYQIDDKYECSQYDFDGNLKMRTSITSDDKDYAYYDVYNLPNGGFYVLGAGCYKGPNGGCVDWTRYTIGRVDANGTKTGSIVFQGLDRLLDNYFKILFTPLFYENDSKEVCFSLAVTRVAADESGRIDLTANWFTDADFSK